MNLNEVILGVYPKAQDCVNGHIGRTVSDTVAIAEEDRIEYEKVYRCSHCGMVKTNKIEVVDKSREYKAIMVTLLDLTQVWDWVKA